MLFFLVGFNQFCWYLLFIRRNIEAHRKHNARELACLIHANWKRIWMRERKKSQERNASEIESLLKAITFIALSSINGFGSPYILLFQLLRAVLMLSMALLHTYWSSRFHFHSKAMANTMATTAHRVRHTYAQESQVAQHFILFYIRFNRFMATRSNSYILTHVFMGQYLFVNLFGYVYSIVKDLQGRIRCKSQPTEPRTEQSWFPMFHVQSTVHCDCLIDHIGLKQLELWLIHFWSATFCHGVETKWI